MTEEQKRAIYEWLYDDLKGRDMRLALCDDRAGHLKPLPPLDMNTWHGPVEEKLAAEGIRVEVCMDSVDGRVLRSTRLVDENFEGENPFYAWDGSGSTAEEASYAALLQYIEAVRQ